MRTAAISTIVVLLSLSSTIVAQPRYHMVDLGDNMPLGINRDGAMAGINLVSERAVLIQGDAVTDLGTLGGRRSAAHGLNAKTTVVGDAEAEIVPEDEQ